MFPSLSHHHAVANARISKQVVADSGAGYGGVRTVHEGRAGATSHREAGATAPGVKQRRTVSALHTVKVVTWVRCGVDTCAGRVS